MDGNEVEALKSRVAILEVNISILALAVKNLAAGSPARAEIASVVDKIVDGNIAAHDLRQAVERGAAMLAEIRGKAKN